MSEGTKIEISLEHYQNLVRKEERLAMMTKLFLKRDYLTQEELRIILGITKDGDIDESYR